MNQDIPAGLFTAEAITRARGPARSPQIHTDRNGRPYDCRENDRRWADEHSGKPCTLDGKPAKIVGRLNRFATIAILPDGYSCEFTWRQVDNVMTFGGRFMSGMTEAE